MSTSSMRRLYAVALVSAGLVAACKKNQDTTATEPTVQGRSRPRSAARSATKPRTQPITGRAMATKYLECAGQLNASNWDAIRASCIEDGIVAHHVDDRDLDGADGVIRFLQDMKTAVPDLKLDPQLLVANGRHVMSITLLTGTHRGTLTTPLGDVPPTNKRIGQLVFHRLAVTGDLEASEAWWYADPATQLGQLGKLPDVKTRRPVQRGIAGAPIIVTARDDEKERANLTTIAKRNQLFSAHKLRELMTLYTSNAIESDQAAPVDWRGKSAIRRGHQMIVKAFSDARLDQPTLVAAGDYVVSIGRFTGTHDVDKQVAVSYAEVIKLQRGKIARVWRFRNGLAMADQLGLAQARKQPPR